MHITFNGVSSASFGLYLTEEPTITQPERQTQYITVPGRDGDIIIDRGGLKDVKTELKMYIRDVARLSEAMAYLTGSGQLIISTDTAHAYKVYFPGGAEADRLVRNMKARELSVPARFKPYRYLMPAAGEITLTAAGSVTNPGTGKSAPRLAVTCTGSGVIYIGSGYSVELEGIAGGCVIDSESMDVYAADGVTPMYAGVIMDEFPLLTPGGNAISWTGDINQVRILPRWRDI